MEDTDSKVGVLATGTGERIALLVWDFAHEGHPGEQARSAVSINLANLAPGAYQLRRQLIDADHLGPEATVVEDTAINSNGGVTLDFELQPYGLTLIELTPKRG